ncbi:MAG: sigma-54 dependent transcriptional regulator [Gammaproteobacteria bacterium]|nr:sigma-54 dependent transcriptional regulator [Gammaproteobacteria bacterium]MBU2057140.1 sigma-54 dependent transcriptional regulator [Gammaproteobacteria bacterium]MBU2175009.1 sigma-54 dependent transcriptional regulator [Gammaproteobacteria bacterium]MBU2246228.1 sigma-54 dependent transcriptional regulator [Gammaproteobacteria bacterium]MBU2346111.1 sigma-54 dependent transcriptional regulator [Gammaproteobacteria bacterium]
MNTLLTWLGNKDIENMKLEQNAAIAALALKSVVPFDKIVILANHFEAHWEPFERFLKKRLAVAGRPQADISVQMAHIESPIDYPSIAKVTEKWISKLSAEADTLSINLTSGTPAMTTLSVLIGKAKANTVFVQTTPLNEVSTVEIPLDFGKEYLRSAAKQMAQGAASSPRLDLAFSDLTAHSAVMKQVVAKAKRIAASEVPALILGETGTGKEMMAKAIHKGSLRSNKPLKTVNCGALTQSLVDSTLFGHKKGAFTGADKDYPGLFEQAHQGCLFLDEVGELTAETQVKLLRALQQGEITRLGDTQTINVDVRVIAATHQDLIQLVSQGKFREDLFYRLAVGIITMPSLKERTDDIPVLVAELSEQINQSASKHPDYVSKEVSEQGIKFICGQSWSGNIRELWSTLNRAFLWSDAKHIGEIELSQAMIKKPQTEQSQQVALSYHDRVDIIQLTDNYQKNYIEAALKASGNVKKHATQMLGLKDHQTLSNWMKRLGIETEK